MQTNYATTTHFIRHEGNLVDLTEYRRRLALARGERVCGAGEAGQAEEERRAVRTRSPRRRRRALVGMALDWTASAAVIVTALSFAAKIL